MSNVEHYRRTAHDYMAELIEREAARTDFIRADNEFACRLLAAHPGGYPSLNIPSERFAARVQPVAAFSGAGSPALQCAEV